MSNAQPAVGIDLGTTFSVVAFLNQEGKPQTIQNSEGDMITPSVVYFGVDETVVGKEAVKVAQFEPESVAQFAKRDVGKSQFHKEIRDYKMPPEAIQAIILKKLQNDAAVKIGEFKDVVITVPAFFNEPRRKATMDAGKLAGLNVLDIINEPTAAAIAFGVQEGFVTTAGQTQQKETILVYDLGGGTFDVTLMEIDGMNYKALATGGDVHLGGIDWDERLVDFIAEDFEKQHEIDPRIDPVAWQELLHEAEDAKRALSTRGNVVVHFSHDGQRAKIDIVRDHFESITEDLLQRTMFTVNKVLREGKRTWKDVTRLLLVGGSTRMPMIQGALERESGMQADRTLSPDEAVAHGAALYAGFLSGGQGSDRLEMHVTNVSSHDLGVMGIEKETGLPRRSVLIARNTSLPAKNAQRFRTRQENQPNVKVEVVEGGDASGKNSTAIGKCIVTDLPENLPAGTPIAVLFVYETNGRLKVAAKVAGAETDATMVIERASGLSDRMIQQWTQWINDGSLIAPVEEEPEPEPGIEEVEAVEDELEELADFEMTDEDGPMELPEAVPLAQPVAAAPPVPPAAEPAEIVDLASLAADDEIADVEFVEDDIAPAEAPAEGLAGLEGIDDAQVKPPDDGPGDWSFLNG